MSARNSMIRACAATAILLASVGSAAGKLHVASSQSPSSSDSAAVVEEKRSAKQKILDQQAQRLVTMAGELKVAVDKTNKNILSLDVVRKAEDIEELAHKMKEQGRRLPQ